MQATPWLNCLLNYTSVVRWMAVPLSFYLTSTNQQPTRPRHKNSVGQWTVGCVIGIAVQERWQDKGRGESQGFQLSVHTAPSVTCPYS